MNSRILATVGLVVGLIVADFAAVAQESAAYYRQKAAASRAAAARENELAAEWAAKNLSSQANAHRQAAQAYLNAAAQYEAKAGGLGGSGGGSNFTSPPGAGFDNKALQLQQFQNSLGGLLNAFQAMQDRKDRQEALRREAEKERAEDERQERMRLDEERMRLDQERLEESRHRFGSLSSLLGGRSGGGDAPSGDLSSLLSPSVGTQTNPAKAAANTLDGDWLVGEARSASGSGGLKQSPKAVDTDWLARSASSVPAAERTTSILDSTNAANRDLDAFKSVVANPTTSASIPARNSGVPNETPAVTGSGTSAGGFAEAKRQLQQTVARAEDFYGTSLKPVGREIAEDLVDKVLEGEDIDLNQATKGSLLDDAKRRVVGWARKQPLFRGKSYDDLPEETRNDIEMARALDEFKLRMLQRNPKAAVGAYQEFQDKALINPLQKFNSDSKP